MKVYIDTQIYRQYASPGTNIEPLVKLKDLIKKGKIELIVPRETDKEIKRQLENAFKEYEDKIKQISKYNPFQAENKKKENKQNENKQKKYAEKELRGLKIEYLERSKKVLEKLYKKQLRELELHSKKVQTILNSLFKKATILNDSDDIVLKAVLRYARNLPPKKNDDKYGDAIIWETLKEHIRSEELTIICKDNDFKNPYAKKILSAEWKKHTNKKIIFYLSLAEFVTKLNPKEPINKETIQKEKVQTAGNLIFSPVITKGLSYEITGQTGPTGPIGPTGPFEIHTASGYPSSVIAGTYFNNNPTLINPQYDGIIPHSGILGISERGASLYGVRRCTNCKNELPESLLMSPIYCPVCGTYNN